MVYNYVSGMILINNEAGILSRTNRDIIKIQKDNNEMYLDYNDFEEFLKTIEQDGLSPEERKKYINIIEELSKIDLRYSVQAKKCSLN